MITSTPISLQDYEYWNGYIREEVVDEVLSSDGRKIAVLTRNNYGALILNTDAVFFGDIDVTKSGLLSRILEKFGKTKKDKPYYVKKVENFQKENNQYTIKVYETFAGLRLVITNQLFNSQSSDVKTIFSSLDSDPLYVMLCQKQACFRARLSPKPWRVGIERPASRFPRSLQVDQIEFDNWLKRYFQATKTMSVVKHLTTFGSDRNNKDVDCILAIHDKYACKENLELV